MKILGITDSVHTCDCCDKKNLKRTVCIELDNGDIVHYGTTCATKKHTGKKLGEIRKEAEINKAAYIAEKKNEAVKSPEYAALKKAIAEAKKEGLKLKDFADHNKSARIAFFNAVDKLIEGNPYGVEYLSI